MFESFDKEEMNEKKPEANASGSSRGTKAKEFVGKAMTEAGNATLFIAGVGGSMVILSSILAFTGWGLITTLICLLIAGLALIFTGGMIGNPLTYTN